MKTWFNTVLAFVVLTSPSFAQGKLNVMTTTEDLASIAREVGGDRISVESIAKGYQDPHFVEAKPSFILKLQKADLLIVVGRELEIGWLPPLQQQSRNGKIQAGGAGYLDASLGAQIMEIPTGQVTRAMAAKSSVDDITLSFDAACALIVSVKAAARVEIIFMGIVL